MAEPILVLCAELTRRQQLLEELDRQRAIRRCIHRRHHDLVEQARICVGRSHQLLERPVWTTHRRLSGEQRSSAAR